MFHGSIQMNPITGNCINCIHLVKGKCNITNRVMESRCTYYEEPGKWYKIFTGKKS